MTSQNFDFASAAGYRLSGLLEQPDTNPRAWAIFTHCFTCGKDALSAARIARALAQAGIGILRFDFAGVGSSDGSFAGSSFVADARDLITADEAMSAAGMPPALLVGHSLGGAAALLAANEIPPSGQSRRSAPRPT